MAYYFCANCGALTGMMGHMDDSLKRCNPRLLDLIDKLQLAHPTASRTRLVDIVGHWQIGEVQLPLTQS